MFFQTIPDDRPNRLRRTFVGKEKGVFSKSRIITHSLVMFTLFLSSDSHGLQLLSRH